MGFDPEAAAAETGQRLSRINEMMTRVRYDPPSFSLRDTVIGLILILALAYGWHWWAISARDAWWRENIARSSAVADAILHKGATVATATDEQMVEGLKDADEKRRLAEKALRDASSAKPTPNRRECRVPAHCLR